MVLDDHHIVVKKYDYSLIDLEELPTRPRNHEMYSLPNNQTVMTTCLPLQTPDRVAGLARHVPGSARERTPPSRCRDRPD